MKKYDIKWTSISVAICLIGIILSGASGDTETHTVERLLRKRVDIMENTLSGKISFKEGKEQLNEIEEGKLYSDDVKGMMLDDVLERCSLTYARCTHFVYYENSVMCHVMIHMLCDMIVFVENPFHNVDFSDVVHLLPPCIRQSGRVLFYLYRFDIKLFADICRTSLTAAFRTVEGEQLFLKKLTALRAAKRHRENNVFRQSGCGQAFLSMERVICKFI